MENFKNKLIQAAYLELKQEFDNLEDKSKILRSNTLIHLLKSIKDQPSSERAQFGKEVNRLRNLFQSLINQVNNDDTILNQIDVSAPFGDNSTPSDRPHLLSFEQGSIHPINQELEEIIKIFNLMGFEVEENLELDDDFHMFDSLNFPKDHPARDDYDNFLLEDLDNRGHPLLAPAHTSSMQHRILKDNKDVLFNESIAKIIPGRVFRNENIDARHEHTFYQLEGIYVGQNISIGNLISTLEIFLSNYFKKELNFHTQPSYFPFTEPSFEFVMSCPYCDGVGCNVCSLSGWIEIIGCGMIHPNVLSLAGIDPDKFNGFAWGGGIDRLVMMKYGIEDVRYFESGKLNFLRQFK